ncbi:MAG: hypothetical protein PQJ59_19015 [Spirochaetales bacterium]|nr:hypothetical protein [Spirochaetales bacterium]
MGFFKSGGLILLALLIPAALFAGGKKEKENLAPPEPFLIMAGGYGDIALDSEAALKAQEELKALWTGDESAWDSAQLIKAESQVVAGKNIRLIYEGLPGYEGAVVFYPLDGSNPTVTWLE